MNYVWNDLLEGKQLEFNKIKIIKCKCGSIFHFKLIFDNNELQIQRDCNNCGFTIEPIIPSKLIGIDQLSDFCFYYDGYFKKHNYQNDYYSKIIEYCKESTSLEESII